jgi:predicted transposase YbfD/YdcC
LVLAQQKMDDKSNEITAIPILLNLKGSTVTIDAMGCQRTIAAKIIGKEADYLLALKENQGSLNNDVRLYMESEIAKKSGSAIEDIDKGRGRLETRTCFITSNTDWLA